MRLIVVGGGRVGLALLEQATGEAEKVTLIEIDPIRVERARRRFGHVRVVEGDATDENVLKEAGVPDVDALVTATPDDPTNLMVCALAKRLGVVNVVSRVSEGEAESLFAEVGAVPIKNPSHLTAEYLYHTFEVPGVRTFMPVGEDAEVVTLVLSPKSPLVGTAVKEGHFPGGALLIAINRRGRVVVPTGDTVLSAGDVLTLVTPTHMLDLLVGRLMGRPGRRFAEQIRGLFRR